MSRKRSRFKKEGVDSLKEGGIEEKEQEKEEYDAFKFMKDKKQAAAIAGVFFIAGFMVSWLISPSMSGMVIEGGFQTNMDEIGEKGITFINKYFVTGGEATLVSVNGDGELLEVTTAYNGNEIPIYMTRDGEYIILGGIGAINMAEYEEQEQASAPSETQQPPAPNVPKSDVPVMNVFIMSYCPYGLQMEKAVIPVMELLGDKADINIDYVHYIMHGKKEVDQNNYQHCIEDEQSDKFVEYLRCFVQSDDHGKCMTEAGVDSAMVDSCVAAIDEEYKITETFEGSSDRFPPYLLDAELANSYGVGGSPTLVINGQVVSVNRSPEAVKQAICNAFNTAPEECSQTLSTAGEGPGIGPLGSGSGSGSTASCG